MSGGFQRRRGMEAPLHSKILMAILLRARKERICFVYCLWFLLLRGGFSLGVRDGPPFLHHVPRRAPTISASRHFLLFFSWVSQDGYTPFSSILCYFNARDQ
jgi:hypothetical protein